MINTKTNGSGDRHGSCRGGMICDCNVKCREPLATNSGLVIISGEYLCSLSSFPLCGTSLEIATRDFKQIQTLEGKHSNLEFIHCLFSLICMESSSLKMIQLLQRFLEVRDVSSKHGSNLKEVEAVWIVVVDCS